MPKKKSTENTPKRNRNFVAVVYPDSAPDDWLSILEDQTVPALISPLHDSDLNDDGTPKKAHWHVMLMFENLKTDEQAKEIFDLISGVKPRPVKSLRSQARYFCHLDNPDKHQYDPSDVIALCGVDYLHIIGSSADRRKSIKEMQIWCRENGIVAYCDLVDYAMIHREDWYDVLIESGSYPVIEYLKSMDWKARNPASPARDPYPDQNESEV